MGAALKFGCAFCFSPAVPDASALLRSGSGKNILPGKKSARADEE